MSRIMKCYVENPIPPAHALHYPLELYVPLLVLRRWWALTEGRRKPFPPFLPSPVQCLIHAFDDQQIFTELSELIL